VLNNFKHCRPEVAVIRCAFLLPGNGEGLAWVAACDDINFPPEVERPDIVVDWDIGPVLAEDGLAEGVLFTECDCPKRSGCFKPKAESSDPAEEIKDGEVFF